MDQTMDQTATAIFQIKSWQETPFSEAPDGPKLTKGSFVLTYQGDLQGEGILEELKVHFPGKCAVFYGLQRVTGHLGNRSGSFILKHTGRFVNGTVSSKQTVVPGSGTDGLKGLRGEMNLRAATAQEFPVTFQYHFA